MSNKITPVPTPSEVPTKEIGTVCIQYIEPHGPNGKFDVIYDGLTQLIEDTERPLAILTIVSILSKCFEKYGFPQPESEGPVSAMGDAIYDTYPRFRFRDISEAFKSHTTGAIDIDLTTYNKPLTAKQVIDLLRVYQVHKRKEYRHIERLHKMKLEESTASRPTVLTPDHIHDIPTARGGDVKSLKRLADKYKTEVEDAEII